MATGPLNHQPSALRFVGADEKPLSGRRLCYALSLPSSVGLEPGPLVGLDLHCAAMCPLFPQTVQTFDVSALRWCLGPWCSSPTIRFLNHLNLCLLNSGPGVVSPSLTSKSFALLCEGLGFRVRSLLFRF